MTNDTPEFLGGGTIMINPVPTDLVWYGYVTGDIGGSSGVVHVRRYYSWGDYKEMCDSSFVRIYTRLFDAPSREVAIKEAKRLIMAKVSF